MPAEDFQKQVIDAHSSPMAMTDRDSTSGRIESNFQDRHPAVRPTREPTAEYGWNSRTEEVEESRWMKHERGTSIQPPWTYFANLDLYDSASMKRLAKYMHYHLNGIDGSNDVALWASNKEEMREMKRMYEESSNSLLLTDMLNWFSTFHESSERIVSNRASELSDIVNYSIRHPEIYKVGYLKEKKEWNRKDRKGAPSRTGFPVSRKARAIEEEEEEEESPRPANRRNFKTAEPAKKPTRKIKVKPARTTQAPIYYVSSDSGEDEEEEEQEEQDEENEGADQQSSSEAQLSESEEELDDGDTYFEQRKTPATTMQLRRKSNLSPLEDTSGRRRKVKRDAMSPQSDLTLTASTAPTNAVPPAKKNMPVKTDLLVKKKPAPVKVRNELLKGASDAALLRKEKAVGYNVFRQTIIEGRGRTTRSGRGYNQYTTDEFEFEGHLRFDAAAPATSPSKVANMGPPARPAACNKATRSASTRSASGEDTPSGS